MSHKLNRAALTALLMIALPSWASDLPTSENPATGKWMRMRPSSFHPTLQSAIEQCNRTAAVDAGDRLTPEKCVRFEEKLRTSECRKVLVIDGVVFDFMNGRESGQSRVTRHVAKQIGRPDVALLCDLGDQVYAYWFMGDQGRSCNNVGIVFEAPPTVRVDQPAPKPADPPPPPPVHKTEAPALQLRCVPVTRRYIVPQAGQAIFVPGLSVAVCRGEVPIPDVFINIPSTVTVVIKEDFDNCQ